MLDFLFIEKTHSQLKRRAETASTSSQTEKVDGSPVNIDNLIKRKGEIELQYYEESLVNIMLTQAYFIASCSSGKTLTRRSPDYHQTLTRLT